MRLRWVRLPYYISSFVKLFLKGVPPLSVPKFFIELFKPTKVILLRKFGMTFKLKTYLDLLVLKEVVLDEEYESLGVAIDEKDKIIIDIGAGFGDFSIMIAKKFPGARIYAFEPDQSYFSLLKENIKINNVQNVFAFNTAVNSLKQLIRVIQSNPIQYNLLPSM